MATLGGVIALGACSPAAPAVKPAEAPVGDAASPANGGPWKTKLAVAHSLVGKIWSTERSAFVGPEVVFAEAAKARFVLLGEKHDNPDHHRLQARVIESLAAAGARPAVVLEMVDRDRQGEIDSFLGAHPGDAEGLGPALAWEKHGWPAWSMYAPIARAALGAGLPLKAGNLPTAEARAVVKGGLSVLDQSAVASWGLRTPLEGTLRASLDEELRRSHCGHLPESILPGMGEAQRARDASMADLLVTSEPAVLVAGAGHARLDRGVPLYLRARRSTSVSVSIAWVEVADGIEDPGAYADRFAAPRLPFTFVWFTPRVDDADPCDAFSREPRRSADRGEGSGPGSDSDG
jgi:uncharacterized iron-regulated protein